MAALAECTELGKESVNLKISLSLYYIPETNITQYANYTGIKINLKNVTTIFSINLKKKPQNKNFFLVFRMW